MNFGLKQEAEKRKQTTNKNENKTHHYNNESSKVFSCLTFDDRLRIISVGTKPLFSVCFIRWD